MKIVGMRESENDEVKLTGLEITIRKSGKAIGVKKCTPR